MPRIDWSPDGARLLACGPGGTIRIHDDVGGVVREVAASGYLDARWLAGRGVVAIDDYAEPRHFTMHGAPYERVERPSDERRHPIQHEEAAIASRGTEYLARSSFGVIVRATNADRESVWSDGSFEDGLA